jgi:hypothetical protein
MFLFLHLLDQKKKKKLEKKKKKKKKKFLGKFNHFLKIEKTELS